MNTDLLNQEYNRETFLSFLKQFLPDFAKDIRKVDSTHLKAASQVSFLGESNDLDLSVFEIKHQSTNDARVKLATDGFKLMKNHGVYTALVIYKTEENKNWRLSLLTTSLSDKKTGGVKTGFSNPKRYSFFLGPDAKVNTPYQFLIKKGQVKDYEDLKSRFSIEVVNKEFYKQISQKFTQLVGGTLGTGKKQVIYQPQLKLPSITDHSQTSLEFGVRLIGRIIFCWFLREKKSKHGKALMPQSLLSLEAIKKHPDYYHNALEPIFFEVLNKQAESRKEDFSKEPFSDIPYLNGGLFSPHDDDFYKRTNGDLQSQFHNTLAIPDKWFKDLFEILETYNFTIDENTSFDEELSIDPEMLGRIFENLLAEINPETGESARKSTGSYYTPRVIVEYMVDESLLLYLKEQTKIEKDKLKAIISYDLTDDAKHPLKGDEKEKITTALDQLKLLDPACGSGAFPIGALQKIVFVLQQIDPDGQLWFKKQIEKLPPELKRKMEKEHEYENYDYIRKLGIIRKNIYGVDIQPIATEISRLRCFLTLVVDQYVKDSEPNRNIEPLPNLDFKFVTANSLISLPKPKSNNEKGQMGMFDDQSQINELKELRDRYFSSTNSERLEIMHEFSELQKRMYKQLVREHGFTGPQKAELTDKLTDWEPFTHKMTSWFDPEWMFGVKEGFDIVIGNPPYISALKASKRSIDNYRQILKLQLNLLKGAFDLYVAFLLKGEQLIRKPGVYCWIIPNKFLVNKYAEGVIKYLRDRGLFKVVGVSTTHVFDADVYPILIFGNTEEKKFQIFDVENYDLLSSNALTPRNRIIKTKQTFVDKKIEIASGTTGFQASLIKSFLSEKSTKDSIPFIVSGCVDPYKIDFQNVRYMGETYMKAYIRHDPKIPSSKWNFWLKPKIVIAGMTKRIEAVYVEQPLALGVGIYAIYGFSGYDPKLILALLNSKLYSYYLINQFRDKHLAGGYLAINKSTIEKLPITEISKREQKQLIDLVDKQNMVVLQGQTAKLDITETKFQKKIDQLVYKLYGLTPEEIKIVEEKQNV